MFSTYTQSSGDGKKEGSHCQVAHYFYRGKALQKPEEQPSGFTVKREIDLPVGTTGSFCFMEISDPYFLQHDFETVAVNLKYTY